MENENSNVEVITDWRDSLPDTLKSNPSLADVKDIGALAQRFVDTKAMVGNSMRMPTDDAGQEDITAFANKILENANLGLMRKPDSEDADGMAAIYNSMGRPEDVSGYVAGEGVDATAFGAMAATAHELGLSKHQYEAMSLAHAKMQQGVVDHQTGERNQGLEQLQGEWGGAYNEKVGRAGQLIKQLGGHEQLEKAIADGNIDAQTLRLFDTIAQQVGAEGTPLAEQVDQVTQRTPDELRQRRNEITDRLIKEDMSQQQRDDLQAKLIALSEQIAAYE
ncbi:MAG: hypothetical protein DRQ39_08545 [Gammaproteobacteria bacterium]|nr:MAG: hypothetical protein DRQ39_08545 [Gammaproteobacteria bacterium]RKZ98152.1 MAG: hypothetical protein DRQ42_08985 [Gammaproteobacteria bacterium]